ncbi:hypothetical protein FCIRC_894 [Fusarium circinatum]|uniref:Uncharacterized protein n=1 Tax=Fusarium circinatum TaxID=48490 RepID=A0A8H5UKE7_FUSCI|nr:hypothetical protein FCIRC_894 [Fusarium circinatum]
MLPRPPRLVQLEAHFLPRPDAAFMVPPNGAFAEACGMQLCQQVYHPETSLLKFTLFFTRQESMKSPRKTKEFLWGILESMGVLGSWNYYRIFIVDEFGGLHEQFYLGDSGQGQGDLRYGGYE